VAESEVTTIRQAIEVLTELASTLPDGMETQVEFGLCNGVDLQMFDEIDVDHYTHVSEGKPDRVFVMFRAHAHPGEEPGRQLRDATADVDEELRDLLNRPEE
jgi:hypothetical protein